MQFSSTWLELDDILCGVSQKEMERNISHVQRTGTQKVTRNVA